MNDNEFTEKLLNDTLEDMRIERKFLKKLCIFLCIFVIMLILGIIGACVYNQRKIFDFVNNTEFTSEIDVNNESSTNNGTIRVN